MSLAKIFHPACCGLRTIECERLETIGKYAFDQTRLKSIDLPSAKTVEEQEFQGCDLVDLKFGKYLESNLISKLISLDIYLKRTGVVLVIVRSLMPR